VLSSIEATLMRVHSRPTYAVTVANQYLKSPPPFPLQQKTAWPTFESILVLPVLHCNTSATHLITSLWLNAFRVSAIVIIERQHKNKWVFISSCFIQLFLTNSFLHKISSRTTCRSNFRVSNGIVSGAKVIGNNYQKLIELSTTHKYYD